MTTDHGLTEAELAGLSPEERAAVTADPSDDEVAHGAGKPAAASEDDDPSKAAADPLKGTAAVALEKDPPGAEVLTDGEPRGDLAVAYQAEQVDLKALQEKRDADLAELNKKFEEGDLTQAEWIAQRDAVRDEFNRVQTKTEISAEHDWQVENKVWERDVEDFLDRNEAYKKDPVLFNVLDARVKAIAADPTNANLTNRKVLQKAHEEIAARFKVGEAKQAPSDPVKDARKAREPKLDDVPKTLAHIPQAGGAQDVNDGEFAAIERAFAEGRQAEGERMLARLTPEQEARFAAGGS